MRIIFSIIFNGLHHLLHNDQFRFILNNCDKWIVVEGASQSNGSTKWCKQMPPEYHNNGSSIDGTKEFLEELSQQEFMFLQMDFGILKTIKLIVQLTK